MPASAPFEFLLLGLARPAPRGALAVAPRAGLRPLFAITDPYTRMPRATQQQALMGYMMPFYQLTPGPAVAPAFTNRLLPNPYAS
jgi:hypothetical protein